MQELKFVVFSIGAAKEITTDCNLCDYQHPRYFSVFFSKLYLEFRWDGLFANIDSSQLFNLPLKKRHGDLLWIVVKNIFEFYLLEPYINK